MTANKQKANLKNMSCSHQWGDLLFGHTSTLEQAQLQQQKKVGQRVCEGG